MIPLAFTTFVATVLRVVLTAGQHVIARVAYDHVHPWDLSDDERAVAIRIFGDIDVIPAEAWPVFVAVAGGRSGKSYVLGALRVLHLALTVSLAVLAPARLPLRSSLHPTYALHVKR